MFGTIYHDIYPEELWLIKGCFGTIYHDIYPEELWLIKGCLVQFTMILSWRVMIDKRLFGTIYHDIYPGRGYDW